MKKKTQLYFLLCDKDKKGGFMLAANSLLKQATGVFGRLGFTDLGQLCLKDSGRVVSIPKRRTGFSDYPIAVFDQYTDLVPRDSSLPITHEFGDWEVRISRAGKGLFVTFSSPKSPVQEEFVYTVVGRTIIPESSSITHTRGPWRASILVDPISRLYPFQFGLDLYMNVWFPEQALLKGGFLSIDDESDRRGLSFDKLRSALRRRMVREQQLSPETDDEELIHHLSYDRLEQLEAEERLFRVIRAEGGRIRIAYRRPRRPERADTIPTVFSYLYNRVVEEIGLKK